MGFLVKKSRRRGLAKKQKALKKLKEWQKNQRNHTKKEAYHGKRPTQPDHGGSRVGRNR